MFVKFLYGSMMYGALAFQIATRRTILPSARRASVLLRAESSLSETDEKYLRLAIDHASQGKGKTFPNPAVGCVLVRQEDGAVLGSGFHPRAGYPHAEVFALFEAAGHVEDGVEAAKSVVQGHASADVDALLGRYKSDSGASKLFENCLASSPVTAYVTLEPCCHYGLTPPCAFSLVVAQANRVVVGFRDPNPRVDGGGVALLKEAGVQVDMAEGEIEEACHELVINFVKRIVPKDDAPEITGAMRRQLRALANRRKTESSLATMAWNGPRAASNDAADVEALALDHEWLERLDALLWSQELVLLRLNKAIDKKKAAKFLGERIAAQVDAHIAQAVGHTVLLYRPGYPPVLDLKELVEYGIDGRPKE